MSRKPTGRPTGRPPGTPAFVRVERAKLALQKKAELYVQIHEKAAKVAASKGNSAPAEWALSHITALDGEGKEQRVVSPSVDRQQIESGPPDARDQHWVSHSADTKAAHVSARCPGNRRNRRRAKHSVNIEEFGYPNACLYDS